MGVCVCLNQNDKINQLSFDQNEALNSEIGKINPVEAGNDINNVKRCDSNRDLISQRAKAGVLIIDLEKNVAQGNDSENACINNVNNQNEFEEREKPGLEITAGQILPKLSDKVIEIENALPKFELTESEKELIRQPKLKKYTLLSSDNRIYDCQFNPSWEKEGYGIIYYPNKSKYEGIFMNDTMVRGRLINEDGDYYEGKENN